MTVAHVVSGRGTCGRRRVGALITTEGRPLAWGYNGSPPGCEHCQGENCPRGIDGGCIIATHAEINAISWAARYGIRIQGADLYVTMSPCYPCAKALITAGIARVCYDEDYRDDSGIILLRDRGVEVIKYEKPPMQGLLSL